MKTSYNLPLSLCEFALRQNLTTELAAYVAVQLGTNGIARRKQINSLISRVHKLKHSRSRRKTLDKLIELGWVGYNPKTGNHWFRSVKSITNGLGLKGKIIVMATKKDLMTFKSFTQAAIINNKLRLQQAAILLGERRKQNPAVKKLDTALQDSYTGMGKYKLAEVFGVSTTEAVRIKKTAVKSGYLQVGKRYKILARLKNTDYHLKNQVLETNPALGKKLFFRRSWRTGELQLCQQLHDHMSSKMVLRRSRTGLMGSDRRKEGV